MTKQVDTIKNILLFKYGEKSKKLLPGNSGVK